MGRLRLQVQLRTLSPSLRRSRIRSGGQVSGARRVGWAGLLAACSWLAALGACSAFAGSRVEPVLVTYLGDTVLTRGTRVPAVIAVTVNGAPLPNTQLVLSSSDPTIFAVTAGGDSLAALKVGTATLAVRVRVESSILTDSLPTLSRSLRVR